MAAYLRHPLLQNPAKHLRGVKKRHAPQLALTEYYDTASLESDPFAAALTATRKEWSVPTRFPLGNMVQVVVDRQSSPKALSLVPVLAKPTEGQNPASYVLNSRKQLEFAQKKHFYPLPQKYWAHYRGARVPPDDFVGQIERLYREEFGHLIKNVSLAEGPGITLVPGDKETLTWDNGEPVFASGMVTERTFVPYEKNEKLTSIIWKLASFNL